MGQPYISISQIGFCNICGEKDDLRFGVCFDCCYRAAGEATETGTYRMWDKYNPRNIWHVRPKWKSELA